MLATVVCLMFQAIEWLRQWRSRVRCMQLIYKHLDQSSVILRHTPVRALPCNDLISLNGDDRHVMFTAHVLWTNGSQQLAVLPSQVQLVVHLHRY